MLTVRTFNQYNRDKRIGRSIYRISADEPGGKTAPHNWYIAETFYDKKEGVWSKARSRSTTSLKEVIEQFNAITREREIIDESI